MTASKNLSLKRFEPMVFSVRLILTFLLLFIVSTFAACEKENSNENEEKEKILTHEDSLALGLIHDNPSDTTTTQPNPPKPPANTIEVMVDGVNYSLNEDNFTAHVVAKDGGYIGNIVIPEIVRYNNVDYSVIAIHEAAFYNNRELLKVDVKGEKLQSIGAEAFVWCHLLSEINLPNSVKEMGWRAFHNCGLTSINLPNNLKEIPKEAFRACGYLKEVKLPNNLEKIGEAAFYDCPLESITLPTTIKEIGPEAFTSGDFRKILCYAIDVPKAEYSSFPFRLKNWRGWYDNRIYLYIPKQSLSLYRETEPWKNCYSISAIEDGLLW